MQTPMTADPRPLAACWRNTEHRIGANHPPAEVLAWLRHTGSLTRLLRQQFGASMTLLLDGERWIGTSAGEAQLLQISPRLRCLERRIVLALPDRPLVMGRTVIPITSLRGPWRRLKRLGTRPLGDLLFSHPNVRRHAPQMTALNAGHPLFPDLTRRAWARRSLFELDHLPILVYELFRPELFNGPLADQPLHKAA
jgi:chorismate--pyruvate lyase